MSFGINIHINLCLFPMKYDYVFLQISLERNLTINVVVYLLWKKAKFVKLCQCDYLYNCNQAEKRH